MKKNILFIFAVCLFFSISLYADKWQTVGARAMGMGGAGVATANGSNGQYWNPASLAETTKYDNMFLLNINAEIETTDKVLTIVDKLTKMANRYRDIVNTINNKDFANAKEMGNIVEGLSALSDINLKNIGAIASLNAGLGAKLKKLAVSVRSYMSAGVTPIVDSKNIGLGLTSSSSDKGIKLGELTAPISSNNKDSAKVIQNILENSKLTDSFASLLGITGTAEQVANSIVNMANHAGATEKEISEMAKIISEELPKAATIIKAAASGSYKDNKSQVLIDAGIFTEISIGYGYEVIKGLQIGGNLKAIQGQMAQTGIMILNENQNIGNAIDKALKDTKSSTQLGIDLGVLFDVEKFIGTDILLSPRIGITARNINSPQFERPDKPSSAEYADLQWNTEKYDLGRQLRAGVAVNPFSKLVVACDIDLLPNETFVKSFDSQDFAAGLEYPILSKKSLTLPIRAGISKNMASSKSELAYTTGFGIYTYGFSVEFAGGISGQTTTLDGHTIPASASCALSIGAAF